MKQRQTARVELIGLTAYLSALTLTLWVSHTASTLFASPVGAEVTGEVSTGEPQRSHPLRSRHPEVERCADCHFEQVQGFLKTGMGRSLQQAQGASLIEVWRDEGSGETARKVARVTHPKTGVTYEAWIDADGRWWQSELIEGELIEGELIEGEPARLSVEVSYIIGSGRQTRSYLGWRDGELVELPLTWYSERGLWDMSPGYEVEEHMRFERPVSPDCLFCHNDLTPAREGTLAGYQEALKQGISCERCHGDGRAHAQAHLTGEGDEAIFNPASLSAARQNQLCQRCHLMGEARVLLPQQRWDQEDLTRPLEEHFVVYGFDYERPLHGSSPARHAQGSQHQGSQHQGPESATTSAGSAFGVASHSERLMMSACAQGQPLLCTSCHDPHQPTSPQGYERACRSCHDPKQLNHKDDPPQLASRETLQTTPHLSPRAPLTPSVTANVSREARGQSTQRAHSADQATSSSARDAKRYLKRDSKPHPALHQGGEPVVWGELDSCVGCHMTRGETSDIPHVRFTDHWIRRRPQAQLPEPKGLWRLKPLSPLPKLRELGELGELGEALSAELIQALEARAYVQLARFSEQRGYEAHAQALTEGWLKAHLPSPLSVSSKPTSSRTERDVKGAELLFHHPKSPQEPLIDSMMRQVALSLVSLLDRYPMPPLNHLLIEPLVQYSLSEPVKALLLSGSWLRSAQEGEREQGERLLRRLIERWPGLWRPKVELADLLQGTARPQEAERLYLEASALAPERLEAAFNLASLKLSLGELTEAERWFKEAQARDPLSPSPPFGLALVALERRELHTAHELASRSLRRARHTPTKRQALMLRVELRDALGLKREARQDVRALLELEPHLEGHYQRLSALSWALGDPTGALEALQEGVRLTQSPQLNITLQRLKAHLKAHPAPVEAEGLR